MEISDNVNNWLKTGERGISSDAIVTHLTGLNIASKYFGLGHPLDPSDFDRCVRLLNACPELRDRLDEMKEVSDKWAILVDHWDELERIYYHEMQSEKAPRLFKRMRELID